MKKLFLIIIFCLLFTGLTKLTFADNGSPTEPRWVVAFKAQGSLAGAVSATVYYGVGKSKQSQLEADNGARVDFQSLVGTQVIAEFQRDVSESDSGFREQSTRNIRTMINDVMRGIPITERWEDKSDGTFWALVKMEKEEFDALYLSEKRRAEERATAELAMQTEQAQARSATELRDKQVQDSLAHLKKLQSLVEDSLRRARDDAKFVGDQAEQAARLARREALLIARKRFLDRGTNNELISLRNGELFQHAIEVRGKMAIDPIGFDGGSFALGFRKIPMEFTARFSMREKTINAQEGAIRLQVLPPTGKLYRLSLTFGVIEFANGLERMTATQMQPQWSVLGAGNLSVPDINSWVSLYADVRMIQAGIEHFLFEDQFDGKISLLFQSDFIFDERWRNIYGDMFLCQAGVRFTPTDFVRATFSYEQNDRFVFAMTFIMGKSGK